MQGSEADQIRDLQSCIESLAQAADGTITVADCLAILLNIICRRVGTKVVAGSVSFLTDRGEGVYLTWPQAKPRIRLRGGEVERGLVTLTRTTNRTQLVGNIHAHVPPGYIRWMMQGQEEISSELAVPIRSLGRAIGVIDVASSRAEAFSPKDRLWLEHVACLIEAVLVRHFMADELAHGKDLSSIQDGILRLAVEASGLNDVDASLLICDKNRQVVVQTLSMRRRTASDSPEPMTNEWSISRGITGLAIRERKEQVIGDLPSGDDIFTPPMPSQLAVPIVRGQDVVGLLSLRSPKANAFRKRVVLAITRLAQDSALIAFIAQLSGMLRREQDVFEALAAISPAEIATHDIENVYTLVLRSVFSLLPSAAASHVLTVDIDPFSGDPKRLEIVYALCAPQYRDRGLMPWEGKCPEDYKHRWIAWGRGVTGEAASTRHPVYEPDVRKRSRAGFIKLIETTKSNLAIPLLLGDRVIGVLNIESEIEDAFTKRDQAVAKLLATQAGFAISSAQNYIRTIDLLTNAVDALQTVLATLDDTKRLIDAILVWALRLTRSEGGSGVLSLRDEAGTVQSYALRLDETGEIQSHEPDISPDATSTLMVEYPPEAGWRAMLTLQHSMSDKYDEEASRTIMRFMPLVLTALAKSQSIRSEQDAQQELYDLIHQFIHLMNEPLQLTQGSGSHDTREISTTILQAQNTLALARFPLLFRWLMTRMHLHTQASTSATERFEVQAAVKEVLQISGWLAKRLGAKRHIEVIDDVDSNSPMYVEASKGDVQTAVLELLDNAIKFSPDSGRVRVSVEQIGRHVEIVVEDEGPGVTEDERGLIFEASRRGKNAQNVPGSGRGLYFVRRTAERYGGFCVCEWRYWSYQDMRGRGSRFRLAFPIL